MTNIYICIYMYICNLSCRPTFFRSKVKNNTIYIYTYIYIYIGWYVEENAKLFTRKQRQVFVSPAKLSADCSHDALKKHTFYRTWSKPFVDVKLWEPAAAEQPDSLSLGVMNTHLISVSHIRRAAGSAERSMKPAAVWWWGESLLQPSATRRTPTPSSTVHK